MLCASDTCHSTTFTTTLLYNLVVSLTGNHAQLCRHSCSGSGDVLVSSPAHFRLPFYKQLEQQSGDFGPLLGPGIKLDCIVYGHNTV